MKSFALIISAIFILSQFLGQSQGRSLDHKRSKRGTAEGIVTEHRKRIQETSRRRIWLRYRLHQIGAGELEVRESKQNDPQLKQVVQSTLYVPAAQGNDNERLRWHSNFNLKGDNDVEAEGDIRLELAQGFKTIIKVGPPTGFPKLTPRQQRDIYYCTYMFCMDLRNRLERKMHVQVACALPKMRMS